MTFGMDRQMGLWAVALALGLSSGQPARAADTEPGTWWEHTVEMQMSGMSMPAQTQKVCMPKAGVNEPPGAKQDDRCKITELKNDGPRMTWKMECSEPERMTGEGEMVRGKDSYTGQMAMHSSQGDMTMKMKGKLVGGDCDAGAMKKKAAAMKKQGEDSQRQYEQAQAEQCQKAADDMQLRLFGGPVKICKDPAPLAAACGRLGTRAGYAAWRKASSGDPDAAKIAKDLCKKDPETIRASLCTSTVKEVRSQCQDAPAEAVSFADASCPEALPEVAKECCAGRKFTGMPDHWYRACSRYAAGEAARAEPASDEPKTPKDQAKEQGKKLLKGLFGK